MMEKKIFSRKGLKNKLQVDYGLPDYYKFYKSRYMDVDRSAVGLSQKQYDVSRKEYHAIICEFNLEIRRLIVDEAYDFRMPFNIGIIGLRKYKPNIKIIDGKIVTNNFPINPRETRKLWDSNPEAKEKKMYVRYTNKHSDGYVFTIHHFRNSAKFKNKTFYRFEFLRHFQREVSNRAKEKSIDAFILKSHYTKPK